MPTVFRRPPGMRRSQNRPPTPPRKPARLMAEQARVRGHKKKKSKSR